MDDIRGTWADLDTPWSPMDMDCPTCGAQIDRWCVELGTRRETDYHTARRTAFERARTLALRETDR